MPYIKRSEYIEWVENTKRRIQLINDKIGFNEYAFGFVKNGNYGTKKNKIALYHNGRVMTTGMKRITRAIYWLFERHYMDYVSEDL